MPMDEPISTDPNDPKRIQNHAQWILRSVKASEENSQRFEDVIRRLDEIKETTGEIKGWQKEHERMHIPKDPLGIKGRLISWGIPIGALVIYRGVVSLMDKALTP